ERFRSGLNARRERAPRNARAIFQPAASRRPTSRTPGDPARQIPNGPAPLSGDYFDAIDRAGKIAVQRDPEFLLARSQRRVIVHVGGQRRTVATNEGGIVPVERMDDEERIFERAAADRDV